MSLWCLLPEELRLHIFSYLEAADLCHAATVCSQWNSLTQDPSLWRRLLNNKLDLSTTDPKRLKELYLHQAGKFTFIKANDLVLVSDNGIGVGVSANYASISFRTACASTHPIQPNTGIHVWTLYIEAGRKNDGIMIGVLDDLNQDFSLQSFEATSHGWAFYSRGKTIHGEDAIHKYGKPFGRGDIVTVVVDTAVHDTSGELSFARNRKYLGVAFKNVFSERTTALYPAVALSNFGQRVRLLTYRRVPRAAAGNHNGTTSAMKGDRQRMVQSLVASEYAKASRIRKQLLQNEKVRKSKLRRYVARKP